MEKPDGDLKSGMEITELKARLTEAEDTLNAIRSGEVDALVAAGPCGDQIFTLHGAETPYRILVEEMNQGALMLTPDGMILYANTRFSFLSKTPLERVIGSAWQQFFPQDKLACLKAAEPVAPQDEMNLQAADGSRCSVHLSFRSMRANGVTGFSVIVTDLTERKKSESALRKTSDELLEKNGQLEAFSYSISHDMRAPLRHMKSFAGIVLEDCADKIDPKSKSYLERIVASAEQLDRLINDVLAYSRVSGDQTETASFDLEKMTREMIAAYPNLREADIEIVSSSAQVRGYKVALGQCISNLLGNAIKFVPKDIVPRIKVWTESANGRVRLWVQDNGIGILPKDQKRIFDVFTRLHSNNVYEGTGLGLSMVKNAVEKMGGRVGVESEVGQGSRFWIELESA
jgi:PAS domain S-box-containing protein